MRVLASANGSRAPIEKLTLSNGIPATVALQYSSGKPAPTLIPGAPDQVMYTLTDGRVMYLPVELEERIQALRLGPREPFTICKHGRREWDVARPVAPTAAPAGGPTLPRKGAAAICGAAPEQPGVDQRRPATEPASKLEQALRTAILAASNAERYAAGIGYVVQFDAATITRAALALMVSMEGGRR